VNISDEQLNEIAGQSWDAIIDGAEPWAGQDEETIRIHTETTRAVLEAAAQALCDGSDACHSISHIEGCFSTNPDYTK
jgi:hypothetical protein